MNFVIRPLLVGSKTLFLFYFCFMTLGLLGTFVLGIVNGFLDPVLVYAKNRSKYKVIQFFLSLLMVIVMYHISLYMRLPDWLVDYFIYGEGGGGLEAGGRFAFNFVLVCFLGASFLFGLPVGFLFVYDKQLGGSTA